MKKLVDTLPMSTAPRVPAPSVHPAIPETGGAAADRPLERRLAQLLASVVQREEVPVDANFFEDLGADSLVMAQFCARVRKQPDLPSVSMKDVYRHPTIATLAGALAPAEAAPASVQARLAEVLVGVLDRQDVPVDANFFEDLGADSLVMAQFCARVRKAPDLPAVSMKDVYASPSIAALAAALHDPSPQVESQESSPVLAAVPETPAPMDARTWEYVTCGVLQVLVYVGYSMGAAMVAVAWYQWIFPEAGPGNHHWVGHGISLWEIYLRSTAYGVALFAFLCLLPVAAKWIIIGRFRPQEIRIWSLAYFRFWLVKTLIRTSPLALMTGSPLTTFYLRALGAKVGRNVTILTTHLPICADLVTIGDGTVIRKDVFANGYRAHGGVIQIGGVTLGHDVLVGEGSVLDINTSMGDRTQLGHRSTLYTGQMVPAGERWHGSPGRRTDVDYATVETVPLRSWRRGAYATYELVAMLGLGLPLVQTILLVVLAHPRVAALLEANPHAFTDWVFYADVVAFAGVGVLGGTIVALVIMSTLPRLLQLGLKPDTVYPLFGVRHAAEQAVTRLTNSHVLNILFGDSSYVVNYMRAIGYDLKEVDQTGSNMGTSFKHDNPFLSTIGTGTMIADGVSFMNTDYSATSFKLGRAAIGARSFLGNFVLYPAEAKVGDNCLLGTKVMVPIDGPMRHDVGLLGSPPFEIPRSVLRDTLPEEHVDRAHFLRDLSSKNEHNLRTMALFLLVRWLDATIALLAAFAALELFDRFGVFAFTASFVLTLMVSLLFYVGVEHLVTRSRALQPRFCSIYNPYFWWHERYWKLHIPSRRMALLNGTPFRPLMMRLVGVKIGARVFDDGCEMTERSLTTIGSRCTLNVQTLIQCHSQEDGAFKSDRSVLGDDVTLGVGGLVHYGVTVEDGVVIAADSFVMKGETLARGSLWGGNPAHEARSAITPASSPERTRS
ncbi:MULTISPECIES: Pls/PosA family non-ribosomal peptide synthetase [Citricoccus]|uniref:Pls/PosA family non-ribosomal peptide synthetase n=1 Tax=Citricoccus TaxID=169133 RepID=UPI000255DE3E|nr:Pls/PosA family non-ribosomal peptide synthetase [Citricoccus sp. CH26A]